jgi:hypothetical protein
MALWSSFHSCPLFYKELAPPLSKCWDKAYFHWPLLAIVWPKPINLWSHKRPELTCSLIRTHQGNFLQTTQVLLFDFFLFLVTIWFFKIWLLRINASQYLWLNLCFLLINILAWLKETEKACQVISFKNSFVYSSQFLFKNQSLFNSLPTTFWPFVFSLFKTWLDANE